MANRSCLYSVSELAQAFSVTPRTVRFYEAKGLLTPARAGGNRVYDYRDKARLSLILRFKDVGFSLDAIKDYLDLYEADETRIAQLKVGYRAITERISDLEALQAEIEQSLEKLRQLKSEAVERMRERGVDPATVAEPAVDRPTKKAAPRSRNRNQPAHGGA